MPRVLEKVNKPKNEREIAQRFNTMKRNLYGSQIAIMCLQECDCFDAKEHKQFLNMLTIIQAQIEWVEKRSNKLINDMVKRMK